jgi:transposase
MMPNDHNKPQTHRPQGTQEPAKSNGMPSKKVYSSEFKLETLRLLRSSGKTKADLQRELGLYPGQIRLWERVFNREGGNVDRLEQAFPGTGHQSDAEAEVSQLKRELEIVRQERDTLRKPSPSSPRRKTTTEIHFHPQAQRRVRIEEYVLGVRCIKRRILHMGQASGGAALKERDG